jgi:uncharacterized protein
VNVDDAPLDARPRPVPNASNKFFWDAARSHRLVLQRCDRCEKVQYPPDVVCVHCQSRQLTPTEMSGRGTLYSFAIVDRVFHIGFADAVPYVIGLIELDDQPALRMLTNIVDVDAGDVHVGMPVEVAFEDRGDVTLPQFRPRRGGS